MAFMGAAFVLAYRTAGSLVWVVLYEPTVRTLVLMGFIAYMMRTKTTTPVDPIDTPPEPPDPQERVRASNGGPTPARVLFSADESDEATSQSRKSSSPTTVPHKPSPSSIPPKNPNWLAESRGASFRPGRRSLSTRSSKVPPLSLSRLARTVSGEGLHNANNDADETPIPSPALTATTNTTDAYPSRTTTARTTARSSAPALSRRSTAAAADAAGATATPATPHTPHTPASSSRKPYEATPPSPNAPNASLLAALPDERPTARSITTARSMARSTARSVTTNRSNWSTQPTPGQSMSGSPVKLSLSEVPRAPNDEPRLQRGERRQSTSELVARLKAGVGSAEEEETKAAAAASAATAGADARVELYGNPLAETSAAREAGDLVASPRQWGSTSVGDKTPGSTAASRRASGGYTVHHNPLEGAENEDEAMLRAPREGWGRRRERERNERGERGSNRMGDQSPALSTMSELERTMQLFNQGFAESVGKGGASALKGDLDLGLGGLANNKDEVPPHIDAMVTQLQESNTSLCYRLAAAEQESAQLQEMVARLEQRNEAMASVLDENEAGLLRLRVQHSDVAEFNATFSRSMDAVQAAQRSVRSGDPQVASSLATCVEGLARGHQQMKALLVQQENTQRELKACRDELRSFTDKKNPASSASAASSQRDDNKLHEVRSRCITLELTNQKLWDINKGLEKDRVAMVKEIAQVSRERFAVGDEMAGVQATLDDTLQLLANSRKEVAELEEAMAKDREVHNKQIYKYTMQMRKRYMDPRSSVHGHSPMMSPHGSQATSPSSTVRGFARAHSYGQELGTAGGFTDATPRQPRGDLPSSTPHKSAWTPSFL